MADYAELGQKFIDDLVAAAPADQQDAVRAALTTPAALKLAGEREATLTQWHGDLDAWAKANKAPAGTEKPVLQSPTAIPADMMRKADVETLINDRLRTEAEGVIAFTETVTNLSIDHFREFGERLDLAALRAHPIARDKGLLGAYDAVHGPKLKEKRDAAAAAAQATRDEEIRRDERSRIAKDGGQPYPLAASRDPSPLDAITPDGAKGASVDDMVSAYETITRGPAAPNGAVRP